jgi:hypothetical protein
MPPRRNWQSLMPGSLVRFPEELRHPLLSLLCPVFLTNPLFFVVALIEQLEAHQLVVNNATGALNA